ncbi:MAG: NUDIX domain-containing protein [Patescibacteria group bacterium]
MDAPKVGVGVVIFRDGKVLLGKRTVKGHGDGVYAGPGGHVELGETLVETTIRETREEAGIEIENVEPLCLVEVFTHGKHYINFAMRADWKSGEPRIMEPDSCEFWDWYDPEHLPSPIWKHNEAYYNALKTGVFYQGIVR